MAIPALSHLKHVARRHWAERGRYARTRDWLMSMYTRVLVRFPSLPLPGRRSVWRLSLDREARPLQVRLGTSDWYIMEEVMLGEEYAPLTRRPLSDVRQVLDLGANVGMSIRLWQSRWPGARIVAVEPDPDNLNLARRNTAAATTPPTFIQGCVAGKSRVVHLDRSGHPSRFAMQDGADSGERIQAMTVPEVCDRGQLEGIIDVMKCDVEGAETEIFQNCRDWIDRVRYLAVEVHHPYSAERLLEDLDRAQIEPAWTQIVRKGPVAVVFIQCHRRHGTRLTDATAPEA